MAEYRIESQFLDFEMLNPSDARHPLPSQAETKSQETAEEADFDKELTDSKKEKVGCGCLGKLFFKRGCQVFVGVAQCYGSCPETKDQWSKGWISNQFSWILFNKIKIWKKNSVNYPLIPKPSMF